MARDRDLAKTLYDSYGLIQDYQDIHIMAETTIFYHTW